MCENSNSVFCVNSVQDTNVREVTVEIKEGFDFGGALESVYPILDIIFDYLNDRDLESVSLVKHSWREITRRISKKRSKLCWVTCFRENKSNVLKHSSNLHHSNAKIGIFLLDIRRLKVNKYICVHKGTNPSKLHRMTYYLSSEIIDSKVNYCMMSCPKVTSYFTADIESLNGSIFDGVLIPEIPDIRTCMFYCNPVKLKKNPAILENYIKPNEEVRCILMFALNDLHQSIDSLFKVLLQNSKPEDIAVGGGIVRGSKSIQNIQNSTKNIMSSHDTFCIVFLREKDTNPKFSAASFVIKGNEYSNQEFHEQVLMFRKRVIIRTHSLGFRICCGAKWEKDEESTIFNEHFPNTPLLGLEADGEIGWDCFNLTDDKEYPESKRKKSKKPHPKVKHEWSTIFVIITWGEIVTENTKNI